MAEATPELPPRIAEMYLYPQLIHKYLSQSYQMILSEPEDQIDLDDCESRPSISTVDTEQPPGDRSRLLCRRLVVESYSKGGIQLDLEVYNEKDNPDVSEEHFFYRSSLTMLTKPSPSLRIEKGLLDLRFRIGKCSPSFAAQFLYRTAVYYLVGGGLMFINESNEIEMQCPFIEKYLDKVSDTLQELSQTVKTLSSRTTTIDPRDLRIALRPLLDSGTELSQCLSCLRSVCRCTSLREEPSCSPALPDVRYTRVSMPTACDGAVTFTHPSSSDQAFGDGLGIADGLIPHARDRPVPYTPEVTTGLTPAAKLVLHVVDKMLLLHEKHVLNETRDKTPIVSREALLAAALQDVSVGFAMNFVSGIKHAFKSHVSSWGGHITKLYGLVNLVERQSGENCEEEITNMLQSVLVYKGVDGKRKVCHESNISLSKCGTNEEEEVGIRTHLGREYNISKNGTIRMYFSQDVRFGSFAGNDNIPPYQQLVNTAPPRILGLHDDTIVSEGLKKRHWCGRICYVTLPLVAVLLLFSVVTCKILIKAKVITKDSFFDMAWVNILASAGSLLGLILTLVLLVYSEQFRYLVAHSISPKYFFRNVTQHRSIDSLVEKRKLYWKSSHTEWDCENEEIYAILNVADISQSQNPGQGCMSGKCSYFSNYMRKIGGIQVKQPVNLGRLVSTGHFVLYERSGLRLCHIAKDGSVLSDKLLQKVGDDGDTQLNAEGDLSERKLVTAVVNEQSLHYTQWRLDNMLDYYVS